MYPPGDGYGYYDAPPDYAPDGGFAPIEPEDPAGAMAAYNNAPTPANQGLGTFDDPTFGYTQGSLLTPWTQPLPEFRGTASGGFSMDPFRYADVNVPNVNVADFGARAEYNAPSPYQGGRIAGAQPYQFSPIAPQYSQISPYQYSPIGPPSQVTSGIPAGGFSQAPTFTTPGASAFGYTPMQAPGRFEAPPGFVPPNITDDPSYQWRLAQGLGAMENSAAARGTLRGADTIQALGEYAQGLASTEYGNAWNRAFQAYNQDYSNRQSAYLTDVNTAMAANAQIFGQGATAYDLNARQQAQADAIRMQAWQTGLSAEQVAAQLSQQAQTTNAQLGQQGQIANAQNALAAWQANTGVQLTQDQMRQALAQYNQAAAQQAWGMNADDAFRVQQANEANAQSAWGMNAQQGLAAHQMNYTNALNAYQASTSNQLAAAGLNQQGTFGAWDRNYQKALSEWNAQYQMGAANAAAGASAANSDYAREMQRYGLGYDIFQTNQQNQFNRLYTMANMGQQSAGALSGQAMNFGNAYGDNLMQGANARASGIMGSAGAWGNALESSGSAVGQGAIMGSPIGQSIWGTGGTGGTSSNNGWTWDEGAQGPRP